MKKSLLRCCLTATMALSGILQGAENPNVGSSFGPSTRVPSAGQPRRMITPSGPGYSGGNNIVTGNVSGMKYFRGIVPYGSSYYTGNNLDAGSSSVNNFLRRSEDPIVSDRNPGQVRPYYQQERTTTRFVRPETLAPSAPSVSGRPSSNQFVLNTTPQMLDTQVSQRPMATNTRQVEELLARQNMLTDQKLPQPDSRLLKERTAMEPANQIQIPAPKQLPQEEILKPEVKTEPQLTAKLLENLQKPLEEQQDVQARPEPEMPKEPGSEKAAETEGQVDAQDLLGDPETRKRMAAEGRKIMGEHQTYSGLAYARYASYMQTAEAYMKEGKFYKAADVYDLAALWRPDESRSYLGKGFSLFAAGEYMSSSYYIARSIELEPSLASRSFELPKLLGGRDTFENRLIELKDWQEKSGSGELAFLMAYLYYHDNRPDEAVLSIASAAKAMPDSKAVQTLNAVITPEPKPGQ